MFGNSRARQTKILPRNVHSPQQQQKAAVAGDPIHDVQQRFYFIGLGHERCTFPHVHDVHDVHPRRAVKGKT
jgi:hypothetical protein